MPRALAPVGGPLYALAAMADLDVFVTYFPLGSLFTAASLEWASARASLSLSRAILRVCLGTAGSFNRASQRRACSIQYALC